MIRTGFGLHGAVLLFLLWGPAALASTPAPWPQDQFNPQPSADDLILPMPCGGSMAFRPVVVPGKDVLDDRRIPIGSNDPGYGFRENQRLDFIAGGFTDAKSRGQRLFYIGKYEVTALQAASLGGSCPEVTEDGALPKTRISWTEAVKLADDYSIWLRANARDKLPVEDGEPGFVRLPTEAEWEYSARGGVKVSEADFAGAVFPMSGPLATYVQHGGPESSNNELQLIGLLNPNPLGVHDILGNAGELVFDLFRINRISRPHGQAGGFVVRGGDYLMSAADVRLSARDEFPPYTAEGPRRQATVGLRLALVAPVLPTPKRVREVQAAWNGLAASGQPEAGGAALPDVVEGDPVKELENLAKAVEDVRVQERLRGLRNTVATNIATRNEQRDRAARTTLNLASYLLHNLRFDVGKLLTVEEFAAGGDEVFKRRLPNDLAVFRGVLAYYRDTLRILISEYPSRIRDDQFRVLDQELRQRDAQGQVAAIPIVQRHLQSMQRDGDLPAERIEADLRRELCAGESGKRSPTACKAYR